MFSQWFRRLRAPLTKLVSQGERIHAQRLRRLHILVAKEAPTEWGRSYIEDWFTQDPGASDVRCPRFAGIVEESSEQAVILARTEGELASDMAGKLESEIPIRPTELVDLDTGQRRLAVCNVRVHFINRSPIDWADYAAPARSEPAPQPKDGRRSVWIVQTQNGDREWHADSAQHAREQHNEAFTGEPGEDIIEVRLA